MYTNTPIHTIAKQLKLDSNKIILACKTLGINAKGATKKLNKEEFEKIKSFFEKGKNASQEIIDINKNNIKAIPKKNKIEKKEKTNFFRNRLIGKS